MSFLIFHFSFVVAFSYGFFVLQVFAMSTGVVFLSLYDAACEGRLAAVISFDLIVTVGDLFGDSDRRIGRDWVVVVWLLTAAFC